MNKETTVFAMMLAMLWSYSSLLALQHPEIVDSMLAGQNSVLVALAILASRQRTR